MAQALGGMGVSVAVLDIALDKAEARAESVRKSGGTAVAVRCDVLDPGEVKQSCETVTRLWGPLDFLINGAGGNEPRASTSREFCETQFSPQSGPQSFFDLDPAAFHHAFDLNFFGTFLVTQTFSRGMVAKGKGAIVNISSMSAFRPLTKVGAYSAAKASVSNFTLWLAVHEVYFPAAAEIGRGTLCARWSSAILPTKPAANPEGWQRVAGGRSGQGGNDHRRACVWLMHPGGVPDRTRTCCHSGAPAGVQDIF